GAPLLAARATAAGRLEGREVTEGVKAGDDDARRVWHEWTGWVAVGLANLIQVIDPDVIVLGGGVSAMGDLLLDSVRDHLQGMALALDARRLSLVCAPGGPAAGVVGAALAGWTGC
ncbi:MAG: ROK family protein, partial [Candidatus Microthrix parvicella]